MNLKLVRRVGGLFIAALVFVGCIRSDPYVSIKMMNRTGGACEGVSLELNGSKTDFGLWVPNGNSGISGGWPYPMPPKATIYWITQDQTSHSATLNLPKLPKVGEFLDYEFVILPCGRAKVLVFTWTDRVDSDIERKIADINELACDGGPNYRIAVKNITGLVVRDVDVRFGTYTVNAGLLLSNTGQNYSIASGLPYPVTQSASLYWKTSDGHNWMKTINLDSILPSNLNDKCFWFILQKGGEVRMQIVDWDDLRAGKHPELSKGF
jgi:hypothetical protein